MALVEAKRPDGKIVNVFEVNLTKSGLLLMITDSDAHQVLLPTSAWPEFVKAVETLFAEEKQQAQAWISAHPDL